MRFFQFLRCFAVFILQSRCFFMMCACLGLWFFGFRVWSVSVCAVFSMSVSAVVSILAALLDDSPPASNDSDIFSLISWVIKLAVRPATAASWPVLTIRDIRHGTRAVSVGLAFHQFLVLLLLLLLLTALLLFSQNSRFSVCFLSLVVL